MEVLKHSVTSTGIGKGSAGRSVAKDAREATGTKHEGMTKWGVGPKLGGLVGVYGACVIAANICLDPFFKMNFISYWILAVIGGGLIVAGLPFYKTALTSVLRAFKEERLITDGAYGMCRHPVYAAWILFFTPGISLLMNTWIGLTVPLVMYVALRVLVREEESYLEERFGDAYRIYKEKVPAVLPVGRITPAWKSLASCNGRLS